MEFSVCNESFPLEGGSVRTGDNGKARMGVMAL
jgi:hypothetical protein